MKQVVSFDNIKDTFVEAHISDLHFGTIEPLTEYKILNGDYLWSHSSVGRAPALQAGGHWFEPNCDHHLWRCSSVG